MSKKEKMLTLVLVGIIIGYGAYQVAYGTNESDYTDTKQGRVNTNNAVIRIPVRYLKIY